MPRTNFLGWIVTLLGLAMAGQALAESDVAGKPVDAGTGFQRAVTPVAAELHWLDDMLLVIITAIVLLVTVLLALVVVKFNRKANPTPASFTHNAPLEVIWTAVPVLILVIIAIPSLRLLFLQLEVPQADLTIRATGHQWYWSYQYPDEGIQLDAFMLAKEDLADAGYKADEYLLATDERIVVPVDKNVHVLVTAGDVIHAWTVPSFGVKIDAIPGRMNETWFRATEVGTYFGQCSELCGKDHSFMPIVVEVVSQEDYDAWVSATAALQRGETATQVADAAAD